MQIEDIWCVFNSENLPVMSRQGGHSKDAAKAAAIDLNKCNDGDPYYAAPLVASLTAQIQALKNELYYRDRRCEHGHHYWVPRPLTVGYFTHQGRWTHKCKPIDVCAHCGLSKPAHEYLKRTRTRT